MFGIAGIHGIIFLRSEFPLIVLIQLFDIVLFCIILVIAIFFGALQKGLIVAGLLLDRIYFAIVRINVLDVFIVDPVELVI